MDGDTGALSRPLQTRRSEGVKKPHYLTQPGLNARRRISGHIGRGRVSEKQERVLEPDNVDAAVRDLLGFAAADVPRFPTGYSLDDTCGCIGPGEMGLIWARSGSGKSTLVLNIICNTPKVPTVVFNMEMTARRQIEWLCPMTFDLSVAARDMDDVLRDKLHPAFSEVTSALLAMSKRYQHLHFPEFTSSPTLTELAMKVDEIGERTGVRPDRVFIDHLTLLKDVRDYENVTKMAAAIHSWAMTENLAVIVVQQTGRGGFDGGRNDGHLPVTLSSGLYAGEHDADWIWGLFRPERDPYFKKQRWEFKKLEDYETMLQRLADVRGIAKLQLIKNRPYGEVKEMGVDLAYWPHSRRLVEQV